MYIIQYNKPRFLLFPKIIFNSKTYEKAGFFSTGFFL